MSKITKIAVIIFLILLWFFISAILVGAAESSGQSGPGIFGVILLFGLFAGIRAVWRYDLKDQRNKGHDEIDDNHKLDKT